MVASGYGRRSRQWRAIGRYPRRQRVDDQYPAGAPGEGPDLQRRFGADRRTQGRTGPRRFRPSTPLAASSQALDSPSRRAGQRFVALNLLEELDAPGEWYVDRARGKLYFSLNIGPVHFVVLNDTPPND